MADRYFDDDTGEPAPPRRKRARMGSLVKQLGGSARVDAGLGALRRDLENREREAKADLLKGGRSKGEEKGYGVTSGRTAPP